MANFPTSVFNPAARSNGQVIDASHINDLQDEVAAIEGGIRQGTAPIASSNSTVANLSVGGGCTIAGALVVGGAFSPANVQSSNSTFAALTAAASTLASLSVTGNSTLAALQGGASTLASLQVSGNSSFVGRPVMPPPDVARLQLNAVLQMNANTTTAIPWVVQPILTNSSMHSTGSNPSQVFPQSTGVYRLYVKVQWRTPFTAGSTANGTLFLHDSSGGVITEIGVGASGDDSPHAAVSALVRYDSLAASPWARAVVRHRTGATNAISVAESYFEMQKL